MMTLIGASIPASMYLSIYFRTMTFFILNIKNEKNSFQRRTWT